ncbi:hypothetical protein LZ30DRAFT_693558 [Colletotrichum cereale]|nr:hypothetical protein LZ30DRAFT_693558 [Colletotrichum cereale]
MMQVGVLCRDVIKGATPVGDICVCTLEIIARKGVRPEAEEDEEESKAGDEEEADEEYEYTVSCREVPSKSATIPSGLRIVGPELFRAAVTSRLAMQTRRVENLRCLLIHRTNQVGPPAWQQATTYRVDFWTLNMPRLHSANRLIHPKRSRINYTDVRERSVGPKETLGLNFCRWCMTRPTI